MQYKVLLFTESNLICMEIEIYQVTSKDGTKIVFDRQGEGPVVILIDGALCTRSSGTKLELIKLLEPHFRVYSYDRRGRGDSEDTKPYAVKREIEDIEALIADAGQNVYLYGHSSGAALALETALQLETKIKKLALYEVPYNDELAAQRTWKEYIEQLTQVLAADRGGEAVALFMKLVGTPDSEIEGMRHAAIWPMFEALGPTLAYDHTALLGQDGTIPLNRVSRVKIPALVMNGSSSFPFMYDTALTLSKVMPHALLRTLEGQRHDVSPEVLAPVLVDFYLI